MSMAMLRAPGARTAVEELAALWTASRHAAVAPSEDRAWAGSKGIAHGGGWGGWRHVNVPATFSFDDHGDDSQVKAETNKEAAVKYTRHEIQERLSNPSKWPGVQPWKIPFHNNRQILMVADFAEMHLVQSKYRESNARKILGELSKTYKKYLQRPSTDCVNTSTVVQKFARLVSLANQQEWLLKNHSDVLGAMLHHIDANIANFRARQVANTVSALGRLGPGVRLIRTPSGVSGNEILQKLVAAAKANSDYLGDRQWSGMLVGLAVLSQPTQSEASNEGDGGGNGRPEGALLELPDLHDPQLLRMASNRIGSEGHFYQPASLSNSLWAMAKMRFSYCEPAAGAILRRLATSPYDFHVADVALIFWSLAALRMGRMCQREALGIQKGMGLCLKTMQDTSTQDLNYIVGGLTGLAVPDCTQLFDAVVEETLCKIECQSRFTDADIIGLIFNFARYQYRPPDVLLDKVCDYVKDNVQKLEPTFLSQAMYFVACFGVKDASLIQALREEMAANMGTSSTEDASTFAWSLALVDELDPAFLKLVADRVHTQGLGTGAAGTKRRVHQCLVHLQHVAKVHVPHDIVPEELACAGREEWDLANKNKPDMVRITSTLKDLGYESHAEVIQEGPITAHVFTLRDGTRAAIEVLQLSHLCVNTQAHVPNVHLWRRRFLEAVGYKVLVVKEWEATAMSFRQRLAVQLQELQSPVVLQERAASLSEGTIS
ncbi:unnamed protein product [Ostreobium quekettii]|uniref:RAP domain-containing protein n=1 Tax=Ostreobium quekettii TaxID=121088 RepID=A0A8S1IMQ8_9CHLO|nr:unnamed protein product [Ostreobium quekettii]